MSELTISQLLARRDALERDAASQLGHMIFEFSRLDLDLGLCLVWVDGGTKLDSLTKKIEASNLKSKLDELSCHVNAKLPAGTEQYLAYEAWIKRAHAIRQQRNSLVHGRWGVEAHNNKVVNVIGMPTSNSQQTMKYTIEELAAVNHELRDLQHELARLRKYWPL